MPRSGEQARARLESAALELFGERGFDPTTAADIAARAGVTGRTFFRHFADKREVLFDIERRLEEALVPALEQLPAEVEPMAAVLQAYRSMVAAIPDSRTTATARERVIAASPSLRERELAKAAAMAAQVAAALRSRGVGEPHASLAADVGTTALSHAVRSWIAQPQLGLDAALVQAFADIRDLFTETSSAGRNGKS